MQTLRTTSRPEQRSGARFDTVMPVDVHGSEGWTRNISSTGVYYETDADQQVGSLVNLTIQFTLSGKRQHLLCEGKVVRVDRGNDRQGVAAQLLTPFFSTAPETASP